MTNEYQQGYSDCDKGIPCSSNRSQAYIEGYAQRYAEEQQLTHNTEGNNHV